MKTHFAKIAAFCAAIALITLLNACSSDKGTDNNNNGGGGGGQREFVSGDLNNGQSFSHTFNTAKVVKYYCRYHGGPNGQGMSGTITVTAAGTAAQFQSDINSSSLQDLTVPIGSTIRWTNNTPMTHTVESDN
jgi:plastocyanin